MRKLLIILVICLLAFTSCQRLSRSSEPASSTSNDEILLQGKDHSHPAAMEAEDDSVADAYTEEPEEQSAIGGEIGSIRELDSINLSNATQTQFLYEGKAGDEFLGLTIRSLNYTQRLDINEWHDQAVAVFFDNEKVIEGYYACLDGPDFIKIIGDMSSIPDFIEEERSVFANKIYVGAFAPDVIELYDGR